MRGVSASKKFFFFFVFDLETVGLAHRFIYDFRSGLFLYVNGMMSPCLLLLFFHICERMKNLYRSSANNALCKN